MSDDTPTVPEMPLPSAKDIVATAGKEPDRLASMKDLMHQAVEALSTEWEKKSTRDALAGFLYFAIGKLFPGAAQSILLERLRPVLVTIIETGSK